MKLSVASKPSHNLKIRSGQAGERERISCTEKWCAHNRFVKCDRFDRNISISIHLTTNISIYLSIDLSIYTHLYIPLLK